MQVMIFIIILLILIGFINPFRIIGGILKLIIFAIAVLFLIGLSI